MATAVASSVRVTMTRGSSASLQEAKHRVVEFFREICHYLPSIMERYNLHEVISPSQLRSQISAEFRKHSDVTNRKVIDLLVFKGQEELRNCLEHAKQRHHLLSTYVVGKEGMVPHKNLGLTDHGESDFLKNFYHSNSF